MDIPWFVDPTEAVNDVLLDEFVAFVLLWSQVDKVLIKSVLSVRSTYFNSRAIAAAGDAVRIRKVILVESFDNNLRRLPPSPLMSTMSNGSTPNSKAKLSTKAWRNNRDDVNVLSNDVNVTSPMNSPPPVVAVGVVGIVGIVGVSMPCRVCRISNLEFGFRMYCGYCGCVSMLCRACRCYITRVSRGPWVYLVES